MQFDSPSRKNSLLSAYIDVEIRFARYSRLVVVVIDAHGDCDCDDCDDDDDKCDDDDDDDQ